MRFALAFALLFSSAVPSLFAHELRPAFLRITEAEDGAYDVFWKVPARGESERLSLQVDFGDGVENLTEPQGSIDGGAHIQRWRVGRDGGLAGTEVRIAGLERTFTDALVQIELAGRGAQSVLLKPERPFFVVEGDPSSWSVVTAYFTLGFQHILLGVDHLLFVLGLLLLVDRRWMLFKTITSFTIAHSITLALSTFAIISVPEPPLNAAIALSILFLGPEIVRKWRGGSSITIRHPWLVAFGFGLLHGIGFASGLSLTGIPPSEIPNALLFFNLGVEAGQLVFVAVALLAARAIRSLELDRPRWVTRIPGYAVGSFGAYWTIQRCLPIVLAAFN